MQTNTHPIQQERGAFGISDFCTWAGISRSHFDRERAAGRIPVRRIGAKPVVTSTDAAEWLASLPLADARAA